MRCFEQHTDALDVSHGLHNEHHMAQIIQTWMNIGQIPSLRRIETLNGMYDWEKSALEGVVNQRVYIPYEKLGRILAYMNRRFQELDKKSKFPKTQYVCEGVVNAQAA